MKEGNILILTQWSFKDALVQTYTLPYVDIIRKVIDKDRKIFLVTAEQERIALSDDEVENINKQWVTGNMELMPQPYKRFGFEKILSSVGNLYDLYRIIRRQKIKTIHAFCTPAGSIGYMLSKITGAKLIIDSYEPHAESMVENGTWKKDGKAFKILFALEKKQTQRAAILIGTTEGMRQYAKEKYGVEVKNFFVKPACVDLTKFSPAEKDASLLRDMKLNDKIVCVYAGKLGGIYLKAEIFNFIKACYDHWHDNFRFLMLTNATVEEINMEIKRVELPGNCVISRFVFHHEIPRYLSLGDFAINPVKSVPTKRYCTSIKDGEYWAMGLPVVISPGISDDSDIITRHNIGVVANLQQVENMPEAVRQIDLLLKSNSRERLQEKIFTIAKQYRSFDIARRIYPQIYER